jgi:hypothetical protein
LTPVLPGHLLGHAEQPVAGVVDDHVERAELAVRLGDGSERGIAVSDIELDTSWMPSEPPRGNFSVTCITSTQMLVNN